MKFFTLIATVLVAAAAFSQEKLEFYKVPKETQKDLTDLASYLTENAQDDSSKIAQIYQWITHNISYDYTVIESGKQLEYQTAEDVLKSKKAVCQGYSALMVGLLQKAGIKAACVEGYTSELLSDTLIYLVQTNHEWVMFQCNSQWYMCDPTWDAGYIGRMPKYKVDLVKLDKIRKRREKKLEKSEKEKKDTRLQKRFDKRDLAEAKKEENQAGKFGSKVGFVRYPQMIHFMSPSDSFVQTHLASIPELQLRENPIRMEDFTRKTKSWDTILERVPQKPLLYKQYLNTYADQKLHMQWLDRADKGFKYNDLNYLGKMLYYHNYIGVHIDPKYRESVEIPKSSLNSELPELRSMNDSVLSYVKPAKQISKEAFSSSKKQYSQLSKEYKASDKQANSLIGKLLSAQEANLNSLKDDGSRIKADLEAIQKKMVNLHYDERVMSTDPEFDDKLIPESFSGWADSLLLSMERIDSLRSNWELLVNNEEVSTTRFNVLQSLLNSSYYNLAILNSAAICYHDTVVNYDTLMSKEISFLIDYHKQIVPLQFYPKEVFKEYKNLERLAKTGLSRLKKYEAKNAAYSSQELSGYLTAIQYLILKDIQANYYQYSNYRSSLLAYEKQFVSYYEDVQDNLKEEKELKVKNIEYSFDLLDKDQKRTLKIIDDIKKNATELEAFFVKRLGS